MHFYGSVFFILPPPVRSWSYLLLFVCNQLIRAPPIILLAANLLGPLGIVPKISACGPHMWLVSVHFLHVPWCLRRIHAPYNKFPSSRSSKFGLPRLHSTSTWLPCATRDAQEGKWPTTNQTVRCLAFHYIIVFPNWWFWKRDYRSLQKISQDNELQCTITAEVTGWIHSLHNFVNC